MAQPGDGGPGRSWFAIELTSEHVEPGAFPWPSPIPPSTVSDVGGISSAEEFGMMTATLGEAPPPIEVTVGGPVPDSSQMVQAGPGYLSDIIEGEFELVAPRVPSATFEEHSAELALWLRIEEEHEATFKLSNFGITVRRDDEEFMLLFE